MYTVCLNQTIKSTFIYSSEVITSSLVWVSSDQVRWAEFVDNILIIKHTNGLLLTESTLSSELIINTRPR